MNERQISNVRSFISSKDVSDDVYTLLLRNFLAKRDGADVQTMAAQMIAVQLLNDAWSEMERMRGEKNVVVEKKNPGV